MSQTFDTSATERLQIFLRQNDSPTDVEQLTPDASTREFFRISFDDQTAIACVYPEKFDQSLPQIDVTNLFLQADLPVAEIFDIDYKLGLLVHQDFGDKILRAELGKSEARLRDDLVNEAISLIAEIQKATPIAFELNSVASKLKFDEEKLLWELNFFKNHYFESLIKHPLPADLDAALTKEFVALSRELETHAKVLTHRDFHAANLMLDDGGNLRIIDHQDARIGSVAYDIVSLLLDRITEPPSGDWLLEKKKHFLAEREKFGLDKIELGQFEYEFDLMTIQRCLKAIGTFSNQAANFDKIHFVKFIKPMFQVVIAATERLERFPNLRNQLSGELR